MMPDDFDGRRRRYVPMDVHLAFGRFGTKLLEKWDMEGLCTWMLFLAACKRERVEGTFTYTTDDEAWRTLGARPGGFTLDEFWKLTGQLHKTSKRHAGRLTIVTCTVFNDWNTNTRRGRDEPLTRSRRASDEVATSSQRASDEPPTTEQRAFDDTESPCSEATNTRELPEENERDATPELEVELEVEVEREEERKTSRELALVAPLQEVTAQQLVARFVDQSVALSGASPPGRVKGQVAKLCGEMLNEGIAPAAVEAGVMLLIERRLHPSALPSLVHEASLPRRRAGRNGRVTPSDILAHAQQLRAEEEAFHHDAS